MKPVLEGQQTWLCALTDQRANLGLALGSSSFGVPFATVMSQKPSSQKELTLAGRLTEIERSLLSFYMFWTEFVAIFFSGSLGAPKLFCRGSHKFPGKRTRGSPSFLWEYRLPSPPCHNHVPSFLPFSIPVSSRAAACVGRYHYLIYL